MDRIITEKHIQMFRKVLKQNEKSSATIQKYVRDLGKLNDYLDGKEVTKDNLLGYKEYLQSTGKYQTSSINSFLVVANRFCEIMKWNDAKVKTIKIQREAFCPENKHLTQEEYRQLVNTAYQSGKERIALIIQTLGSTGIRVSELSFITVESLKRGLVEICCKGKVRKILLPRKLQKILKEYAKENNIRAGAVFQTAGGRALDRSNIWREMKKLCQEAGVEQEKVFPHNLRHLFARNFYKMKQDIVKLADLLGHSSMETTRIYMKSPGTEHQKQLDSMNMVIYTT